jgi:hypothetical protein
MIGLYQASLELLPRRSPFPPPGCRQAAASAQEWAPFSMAIALARSFSAPLLRSDLIVRAEVCPTPKMERCPPHRY